MKYIYLVRHGEVDANVQRYVPPPHEPLNERGIEQAKALAERISHLDIEKVIASDFERARHTAEIIAGQRHLPVETNPVFREMMEPSSLFGVSENDERVVEYKRIRDENRYKPKMKQEDGNNWHDTFERTRAAIAFLENEPAQKILVASHLFFLRLVAATILLNPEGPSPEWERAARTLLLDNAGISLCTFDGKKWKIVTWNDHAHFAE
jgi:broad specificity phosphatase PhoE